MQLCIVIPCYNEQEVLPTTSSQLSLLLEELIAKKKILPTSHVCFVDDGSKDQTWKIIEDLCAQNTRFKGIKLSRNRGHQNALLAGLFMAEGDAIVSIDADLQDDLAAIEKMVDAYNNGFEIVYGVRSKRETDTFFKRLSAEGFYSFMQMMGVDIVHNHADYRLLSKRVLDHLKTFNETNLFLRGMIPMLGFSSTTVYYERAERFAGESKYPLKKMLSFAWDGITSLSVVPLRLITAMGLIIFFISSAMSVWVVFIKLFTNQAVSGWASTVLPIYFIGGIQLLSIGIVGEYIGKIYLETKARPRFIIEKTIGMTA